MANTTQIKLSMQQSVARIIVFTAVLIMVTDTVYMNLNGLYDGDHTKCIVFSSMPKWSFYLLENVGELFIVVILGVMIGVIAEQYFRKIKRFYPRNQMLAFAYASILPVCSCGGGTTHRLDETPHLAQGDCHLCVRCTAARPVYRLPLLHRVGTEIRRHPHHQRISVGILSRLDVELAVKKLKWDNWTENGTCGRKCDFVAERDPFVKTMKITKKLLPYILFAGLLSFVFAMLDTKELLHGINLNAEPFSSIIMTAFGVPIYMCHGADVIFLKPFLQYTDMSLGSAMAFSLSSSAICISSIVMLSQVSGQAHRRPPHGCHLRADCHALAINQYDCVTEKARASAVFTLSPFGEGRGQRNTVRR
jgi:hypothetical protein